MFLEVFLNNKPNHQQWFCIQLDVFLSFKSKVIYLVVICKISLLNTHKPIVYLIVLHKKNLLISQEVFFVDNSIEISNLSFTPVDFLEVNKSIQLII